jgi:hypothetical protein
MKEKMTLHKALAELKLLDSRITSTIRTGTYCVANKASNQKIKGVKLDEFKESMKADYASATDLINRRIAIKKAVVLSNATTKVKINDVEYTVAEAIELKNHGMEYQK